MSRRKKLTQEETVGPVLYPPREYTHERKHDHSLELDGKPIDASAIPTISGNKIGTGLIPASVLPVVPSANFAASANYAATAGYYPPIGTINLETMSYNSSGTIHIDIGWLPWMIISLAQHSDLANYWSVGIWTEPTDTGLCISEAGGVSRTLSYYLQRVEDGTTGAKAEVVGVGSIANTVTLYKTLVGSTGSIDSTLLFLG